MALHRDSSRAAFFVCIAVMLGGCSALIDADPNRLPPLSGVDGGRTDGGGTDGGSRDGALPDSALLPDGGDVCRGGCGDEVACTVDTCEATGCSNAPNDDACEDEERCSVLMGCVPRLCVNDGSCDNGIYCDGEERCEVGGAGADPATGCVPGTPPSCADDYSCTTDSCDEAADTCAFVPNDGACDDGVACTTDVCDPSTTSARTGCVSAPDNARCDGACATSGGAPAVRPGVCTASGCTLGTAMTCVDNPCTTEACAAGACSSAPRDADEDGFFVQSVGATACGGNDCDDADGDVFPGAVEACNGADDDCDGAIDEGCSVAAPDDCASAIALTAGAPGMRSASGSFADFDDDYRSGCGDSGGVDAVYFFDLTALSDVVITTNGATADTVLAVATECSMAGFGLGCDDDIVPSANIASRIFLHRFGPGPGGAPVRIYVLVDTYSNATTTGAFTVTATITAAAADACSTPISITGGGTLVGEMNAGFSGVGAHGSCQPPTDWGDQEALAQYAVALRLRHQEIDVDRLAIFAMGERDRRAAAEQAAVRGEQLGVERLQDRGDAAMMRPLKQAAARRPGAEPKR